MNWSDSTQKKTAKEDFAYLEIEGGAGFNWGTLYFFSDIENPTQSWDDSPQSDLRFTIKPVVDIKIAQGLSLHFQDFSLYSKEFYINNVITGLSYDVANTLGIVFKPFIGFHYQTSTYYSGFNGYMAGWILFYNFSVKKQKFTLSQWHEHTIARDQDDGYENHIGTQGALALCWNINSTVTTGLQYRYASYALGEQSYQNGLIYSLKYNF